MFIILKAKCRLLNVMAKLVFALESAKAKRFSIKKVRNGHLLQLPEFVLCIFYRRHAVERADVGKGTKSAWNGVHAYDSEVMVR